MVAKRKMRPSQRSTVRVSLTSGGDSGRYKRVRAFARTRHLAATRCIDFRDRAVGGYVITHRPSGLTALTRFGNDLKLAIHWMRRLEKEGGDWDYLFTVADLNAGRKPPNLREMRPLKAECERERNAKRRRNDE